MAVKMARPARPPGPLRAAMSQVQTPVAAWWRVTKAMLPSSRKMLPKKVNRKNFMAAWRRPSMPQSPMMKNMGTSTASQNTKKRNRSRARNTPSRADSRKRKAAQ
jgi:hypothetical protein